jgi:hypothetical protein
LQRNSRQSDSLQTEAKPQKGQLGVNATKAAKQEFGAARKVRNAEHEIAKTLKLKALRPEDRRRACEKAPRLCRSGSTERRLEGEDCGYSTSLWKLPKHGKQQIGIYPKIHRLRRRCQGTNKFPRSTGRAVLSIKAFCGQDAKRAGLWGCG